MLGVQILGVIFGLLILYVSFVYMKKREFTTKEFIFWAATSIVFMILSIFPHLVDPLVKGLKFGRTLDFFIVLSFMFLIATNFYTYTIVRSSQNKVEELVRKIALDDVKNRKQ